MTPSAVGFPYAQQAAELRRFIDRPSKVKKDKKTRKGKKKEGVEREFLLTSLTHEELDAIAMLALDREYWGVENGLHLRLDVSAQEDKSRVRTRRAAFNLALFRRAAISFAVHWIQRQPNKRFATTQGFYDEMGVKGRRKAFSLVTARKPNWIPKK